MSQPTRPVPSRLPGGTSRMSLPTTDAPLPPQPDRPLLALATPTVPAPVQPGSFRVALVCMPFALSASNPSLQVALLRAIAEQAGFPADSFHFYLDLAARLTPPVHDALTYLRDHVTSEWLF